MAEYPPFLIRTLLDYQLQTLNKSHTAIGLQGNVQGW